MTPRQSTLRLALYCLTAFLTPVGSNWTQLEGANSYQWGGMLVQAAIASIVAARAYVDQTPSRVAKP